VDRRWNIEGISLVDMRRNKARVSAVDARWSTEVVSIVDIR
jgi:hypothetical protein